IENDAGLRGLVIASAKKTIFVAGADLNTLLQQAQAGDMRAFIAKGQQTFSRLADLKIPTVAAIHGASAGGGYEVTLACDYRIGSDDPATRIGLPETTVGLIPAWGDRKSTRLNSSHDQTSYAVFCVKKKKPPWIILLVDRVRALILAI